MDRLEKIKIKINKMVEKISTEEIIRRIEEDKKQLD